MTASKNTGNPKLATMTSAQDGDFKGIWVRSVKSSFRRCGMRFTRDGYGVALSTLEEGQLDILEQDPDLVVVHVTFTDEWEIK